VPRPKRNKTIPEILKGRDILGLAQTGTGKTAAFALPILQRLHAARGATEGRRPIRVLVLVPTRELAMQVEESVRTYGARRPIRSATIYGGVGYEPQVRALRAGPEVVVATPGRLLDHVGQGTVDLGRVEILVLDEADRMLDMGFIRDIRRILALLPARRQNLLFSATLSDEVRRLAEGFLVEGDGPFPADSPVTLADLDRLYPLAAGKAKEDPAFRDRARKATAELQNGRPGYRALWKHFVAVSREALKREYGDLSVDFDLWNGESDADPLMPEMLAHLKATGLLVEDDGAQVVHVAKPGETRKKKLADGSVIEAPSPPPLLVISSEGSAMYGTTDLATILDRKKALAPDDLDVGTAVATVRFLAGRVGPREATSDAHDQ